MGPSDGTVPLAEPVVIKYSSLVTASASLYSDIVKVGLEQRLGPRSGLKERSNVLQGYCKDSPLIQNNLLSLRRLVVMGLAY